MYQHVIGGLGLWLGLFLSGGRASGAPPISTGDYAAADYAAADYSTV